MQTSKSTSCKDCVFADYDGDTQTGCTLGKLQKFIDRKALVKGAYDEKKEFFVIFNRQCPYFRNTRWAEFVGELDFEKNARERANAECQAAFHIIMFLNDNMHKMECTLESLRNQIHKPIQVTLVMDIESALDPREIKKVLAPEDDDQYLQFKWRIQKLQIKARDRQIIHMVNQSLKNMTAYCVCHAGFEFPRDYLHNAQRFMFEEMYQFAMIEDVDEPNGTIVTPGVHEYFHFRGNHELTVPENLREFQCQNEQKVIYSPQEVKSLLAYSSASAVLTET